MICPKCGTEKARAIYTAQDGGKTKRIRKCLKCDYSFNTMERPELMTLTKEDKKEYEEYLGDDHE